jgi:hypothetical protein
VTQIKAVGVHLGLDPFNTVATIAEAFDPHHLLENVFIKNTKGDSFQEWGQSETRLTQVFAMYSDEISFRPSFDTFMQSCTSEKAGRMGFFIRNSEVKGTNCKAFESGGVTAAEGFGFLFEGPPNSLEEGTKVFSSSGAQDNKADGFRFRNAQRCMVQGTASSNGTSAAGTYVGVKLDGETTNCVIEVVCTERVAEPNNAQRNALSVEANCKANTIRVKHAAVTGSVVLTAITPGSVLTGGNDILINGMAGTVPPVFAAEYTPDPYTATTHIIGALTGNITIAKPSNEHLGCPLRFIFLQDGTGGRTITWNGAFSTTYADTGNTLGKKLIIDFIYNTVSSKWQQVYISQSAVAGTYWI